MNIYGWASTTNGLPYDTVQRSKVGGPLVHMQLRSAGAKKLLWRWGQHKSQQTRSIAHKSAPSGGRRALKVEALVNVDLSPSTFVGLILIVSGAALYQVWRPTSAA